ncbi:hypothetical protein Q31b_21910 [Novipirellula aureliae]|uniref:Uncharacterized protein n=1 Tax=Novipirellula aureliae TaxID=2527966 RepID=A0A5C6E0E5_9BACT|nr:hypothetical protein [Novipirellula aureliae]TWU43153.1 hypothetical protein Q31b_21910 [Novipirellula aureliae]
MRIHRFFSLTFASLMALSVTGSVQADTPVEAKSEAVEAELSFDLATIVSELREFSADESVACEEKIARIDSAIAKLDEMLDAKPENQADILVVRDQLLEIRRSLKCSAHQLANCPDCMGSSVMDPPMMDMGMVGVAESGFTPMSSGGSSGFMSGGGGGAIAGGGPRLGLLAGLGAAIAIPLAISDDDDEPGTPASPSMVP